MRFRSTLVLGLLALGATAVRADIIPTLQSSSAVAGGTQFNYTADVTTDQRVETGDFFTLYDFGPNSNLTAPAGWTAVSQASGVTPPTIIAGDGPELNLTFTYTAAPTLTGPQNLGIFSAVSPNPPGGLDFFASHATKAVGGAIGTKVDNVGFVEAPKLAAIPLPAAAFMFPMGAVAAAYCSRRFRK